MSASWANPADPLAVVGIGATTAVGLTAEASTAAFRAGIAGFEEHPYLINRDHEPYILAAVPSIAPATAGTTRFISLLMPPLLQALAPLHPAAADIELIAIIALPEAKPGVPADLASAVTEYITAQSRDRLQLRLKQVITIAEGHAAGLKAMATAGQLIAARECQFCLVAALDSYIDVDTLAWLEVNDQVHTSSNAWGFVPGEAAAAAVLCAGETAREYRLPVKALLNCIAMADEHNRINTETICLGEGLTQAIRTALLALPAGAKVDQIICDQNGEAYRADEHGFMMCRLSQHFHNPSHFLAPADCWGDVGAASGILYLALTVSVAAKGYAAGPHTLLWAGSENGLRAAALIETGHSALATR